MDFRVYYDVVGGGGCGWSGGLKGRLKGVANTGKGCIFDRRIEHKGGGRVEMRVFLEGKN